MVFSRAATTSITVLPWRPPTLPWITSAVEQPLPLNRARWLCSAADWRDYFCCGAAWPAKASKTTKKKGLAPNAGPLPRRLRDPHNLLQLALLDGLLLHQPMHHLV